MKSSDGVNVGADPRLALLAELGIAAVATDLDGNIRHWSADAARLYGRDEHEMLGSGIEALRLSPEDEAIAPAIVGELLELGRWQGEFEIADAFGAPLRLEARATVLVDQSNHPVGVAVALADLRERVAAERRAVVNERKLRLTQRIGGLGAWEWDAGTDRVVASDLVGSHLGLVAGAELTMADALAAIAPQGRARMAAAVEQLRRGGTDEVSFEYRLDSVNGTPSWFQVHCVATRDRAGGVTGITGTTLDVTARVSADDSLRAAGEFWQGTLDSLAAHIAILDEHGNIVAVNAAWSRFARSEGASSDFVGVNYVAVCRVASDPVGTVVAGELEAIIAGRQETMQLDYACHSPAEQRWFLMRATRFAGAGPVRVVIMHANITARHLEEERAFFQAALLDQIDVSVIVTDLDQRVTSWNAGAERLYGWKPEEAIGRFPGELLVPADAGSSGPLIAALRREVRWSGEYVVAGKDGLSFCAYLRNQVISDQEGHAAAFVAVSMDISERKEAERALLTADNYHRAVTDSMGEGMFTLDVDGTPTYLNPAAKDLLGWSAEALEGSDMHALTHNRRPDGSALPVEECPILAASRDGKVVRVEDDIFLRADGSELPVAYTAAPFVTGDGIEGCVVVFEDITARKAAAVEIERDLEKLAWVERIQAALKEKRFVLCAQPILDLRTGLVEQRELLLRMLPPDGTEGDRDLIRPSLFLPVAEEFGLITEIDRWVIDRALVIAATAQPVQVNVSGRSISTPGLVAHIETGIARTGADPGMLVFEITETALVGDETAARVFVEGLHRLGCKVALDDFGTGYGGFTYLKHLPIDFLKIDVEFVRDMRTSSASRNVVQAIVNLAAGFDLKTIGEGVEDAETLGLLREMGVDYAQGFHIGYPAPLDAFSQPPATEGVRK